MTSLRQARLALAIPLSVLSKKAGVSISLLSRIETGERTMVNPARYWEALHALHLERLKNPNVNVIIKWPWELPIQEEVECEALIGRFE